MRVQLRTSPTALRVLTPRSSYFIKATMTASCCKWSMALWSGSAKASSGECISCGKEINAKRLEAVPWTRHCIECQEKLEQGIWKRLRGNSDSCILCVQAAASPAAFARMGEISLRFVRRAAE